MKSISRFSAACLCATTAVGVHANSAQTTELSPLEISAKPLMAPQEQQILPHSIAANRETGELLRDVLGVSGSRMGGHGIDPVIRGQSQNRVNVLIDGAYIYGACPNRMDPATAYAPMAQFDEVTVIKGTRTLAYGAGGAGGTVIFERNTERFDQAGLRGEVEAGLRSNSDSRELRADLAAGNQQGYMRLIASDTQAQNYEDGDGNEVRSAYDEHNASLSMGFTPNANTLAELSYTQQRTEDMLFAGAGMDSPYAQSDTVKLKLEQTDISPLVASLKMEVYRSEVEHLMDNFSLRPAGMMKMSAPSTSDTTGLRLNADLNTTAGLLTVGYDLNENTRHAERFMGSMLQSVLWPDAQIRQQGVFAELDSELSEENRLIAGLRYDLTRSEAGDADRDPMGMPMSANQLYNLYYGTSAETRHDDSLGGLLRFEHSFAQGNGLGYAALSRTTRAADATERYLAGNNMTASKRWVGNPNLKNEKHQQLEMGMQLEQNRWQHEAAVFYNRVDDYILRDRFTATGNNATIYRNVDATLWGGEWSSSYQFNRNWQAGAGFAYVHGTNNTDSRALAQQPPLELQASLNYQRNALELGSRLRAAAQQNRVDLTSSTGIDGQGLDVQRTPGWGVIDLYGSYAFSGALEMSAGVDNLFDKAYAQHLNRSSAFDPQQVQVNEPGRALWVKLTGRF